MLEEKEENNLKRKERIDEISILEMGTHRYENHLEK